MITLRWLCEVPFTLREQWRHDSKMGLKVESLAR